MMKSYQTILVIFAAVMIVLLYSCVGGQGGEHPDLSPGSAVEQSTQPDPSPDSSQEQSPEQPPQEQSPPHSPDSSQDPGQPDTDEEQPALTELSGELVISFDYVRQSGAASNQHAVWIEDMHGNIIRTLYASRWTADGGYVTRPDSIFVWIGRTDRANMTSAEVDAVSGATPGSGALSYIWDLTDTDGDIIPPGEYMVFVEGTLRWKNYVLYSAVITLGASPATVEADAVFHYEGDGRYAALTADSRENDMIGPVTVMFSPVTTSP